MIDFYKIIENGLIIGFGANGPDIVTEITKPEYDALVELFQSRPTAPDGYAYMIQDDPCEWVLVELPPMPEPELTDEEVLDILLGGNI